MRKPLFTPDELAALAIYDAQVDASDLTMAEIRASNARDREIKGMSEDTKERKRTKTEATKVWYAAHRAEMAIRRRERYLKNRDAYLEYQRAYHREVRQVARAGNEGMA